MRVTAAMEMVSKASEGERSVQCRSFLPKSILSMQMMKPSQKQKRTKAPKARERRRRKRAATWTGSRIVMMVTLRAWRWTTCLMRAGNYTNLYVQLLMPNTNSPLSKASLHSYCGLIIIILSLLQF